MSTELEVPLLRALVGADHATIPQVWHARVASTPENLFLISGKRRWTYRQAFDESLKFGGFLHARGYGGAGSRVASYLSNHPETLWTWFGTVFAGGAYFALNREHKGMVLADVMARSKARILVTEHSAMANLQGMGELPFEIVVFVDIVLEGASALAPHVMNWEEATSGAWLERLAEPRPTDVAGILFTSGTTGRSKAVLLPHNAYCRGAARAAAAWGWNSQDVFHAWLPLFHFGGQMHQMMSMVVVGGAVAQFPTFSRSRFWSQVQETGATVVCGLANVLHLWWQTPEAPDDAATPLRSVLSAAIPAKIHKALERRFGIRIMEQFGMTEAELLTLPVSLDEKVPAGSLGWPGPDFELQIFDQHDRALPPGEVGEIVARPKVAGMMMLGYEGDPEATVEAWRNLWLHTGDCGYRDESGYFYFAGRLKHVIRRRGENISAYELERILSGCPGVAEGAAVGVPSPLGEQDVKIVVALKPGSNASERDIYDYCCEHMARFMLPRYVEILDQLPHSVTDKIEKLQLQNLHSGLWDAEQEVIRGN